MITKAIEELEAREEFAAFKKEHGEAYLAHVFSMHQPKQEMELQLGYCLPKADKIVVFKVSPFQQLPPDQAFTEKNEIKQLDMKNVRLEPEEAEATAMSFFEEKFSAEIVTKVIMILQHLDTQLYNFTLVTMTFNICNIRIDADTGEIVSHQFKSIMSLRESEN